jgi:XTP/dITP diphosphohydrolase
VALARPGHAQAQIAEGTCEGWIAFAPSGGEGFGYDPVFYVPKYGCTMAELPGEVKNQISHRARALQAARPFLDALLDT